MTHPLKRIFDRDRRYKLEAYEFVRDALSFAQDELGLGRSDCPDEAAEEAELVERHLTGQQLCEASRRYALEQYGLMAKIVLNSWGICSTSDLGEIVYNLIRVDLMRKSRTDRREDFNDVFDFDRAFTTEFDFASLQRSSRESSSD